MRYLATNGFRQQLTEPIWFSGVRPEYQAGRTGDVIGAHRKKQNPNSPETSDPLITPSLTVSICSGSAKARLPINRLMVKPMPVRQAKPYKLEPS